MTILWSQPVASSTC